jgi:hypothetical protein
MTAIMENKPAILGAVGFILQLTLSEINLIVSIGVGLLTGTYLVYKIYLLHKNKGK